MAYVQEQAPCPAQRTAAAPNACGLRTMVAVTLKVLLVAAPALFGMLALYAAVRP